MEVAGEGDIGVWNSYDAKTGDYTVGGAEGTVNESYRKELKKYLDKPKHGWVTATYFEDPNGT